MRRALGFGLAVLASVLTAFVGKASAHAREGRVTGTGASTAESRRAATSSAPEAACTKLERANVLHVTAARALAAAECAQKHGDATRAWAFYGFAVRVAEAEGAQATASAGRRGLREVEGRVGRLTVAGEEGLRKLEGLHVRVDERLVDLDEEIAVEPGPHRVVAVAPGALAWSTEVEIDAGGSHVVSPTFESAGAPAEATSTPPPAPVRDQAAESAREPAPPTPPKDSRWTVASEVTVARVVQDEQRGAAGVSSFAGAYAATPNWTVSLREAVAYARPVAKDARVIPSNPVVAASYALHPTRALTVSPRAELGIPVGGAGGNNVSPSAIAGRQYALFLDPAFAANFVLLTAGADWNLAFERVDFGLATHLRQRVRTRGSDVEPDKAVTQLVSAARANVHMGEYFVPFAGVSYIRTLSDSVVVRNDPLYKYFLIAKLGAQFVVGTTSFGIAYQRPLDGPGRNYDVQIFSANLAVKM